MVTRYWTGHIPSMAYPPLKETIMLKGKTALITGSTSGIGKAIAERLAEEGCNIVLNGFGDPGEIDTLKRSIAAEHSVMVGYSSADLTRIPAIENMMAYVQNEFGGADILVNNAGMQHVSPIEAFPVDKWNLIIALNLSAAFHTIRLAMPGMKEKGWGRIIALTSASVKQPMPRHALSSIFRAGVHVALKHLVEEVSVHGVTVNAIAPATVITPTFAAYHNLERRVSEIPLKRPGTGDELGGTVAFLASNYAGFITGETIQFDGGMTRALF